MCIWDFSKFPQLTRESINSINFPEMSRPRSLPGSSQKTLFSFFNKSSRAEDSTPQQALVKEKDDRSGVTTGSTSGVSSSTTDRPALKRRRVVEDDEDDTQSSLPAQRRLMATPGSDEEWCSDQESSSEDEAHKVKASRPRPNLPRPPSKTQVSLPAGLPKESKGLASTPTISTKKPPSQAEISADLPDGVYSAGTHEHHSWSFLRPEIRRDKAGRRPEDPLFNPRTVLVPPSVLHECTPALRQWMEFKAENFDTVLFFKVGKFYELYHMDADIGAAELDLVYMKGSKAHVGFPEVTYGRYANILVSRGYKVARIEQTEVKFIHCPVKSCSDTVDTGNAEGT